MEHLLWKILETFGLLLFVVGMIASALIHTIGYIRFMVGRLRAEGKSGRRAKSIKAWAVSKGLCVDVRLIFAYNGRGGLTSMQHR